MCTRVCVRHVCVYIYIYILNAYECVRGICMYMCGMCVQHVYMCNMCMRDIRMRMCGMYICSMCILLCVACV